MINRCQATLRRCSGLFAYSGCLGQTGLTCRSWPELTLLAGSCACLLTGLIANTKMRHERTQSRSSANHEQLRLSLFDGKIHCRPVDTLRAPFVDHSASTHTQVDLDPTCSLARLMLIRSLTSSPHRLQFAKVNMHSCCVQVRARYREPGIGDNSNKHASGRRPIRGAHFAPPSKAGR